MRSSSRSAYSAMLTAMGIFGTIGLFVRHVPLPSSVIALARGSIGMLFLLAVMALQKKKLSREAVLSNLPVLLASGACLGINWILLFEAYRYTTVSVATLCYYMGPMIVILVSPLLLHEPLTGRRLICVLAALIGIVLVSGVLKGASGGGSFAGVAFGLAAAAFYAAVMLLNKFLKPIDPYGKTVLQLGISAAVLLPYVLLTVQGSQLAMAPSGWLLLLVLGVVHTGLAYTLYFGALGALPAQSAAIMSYLDPVLAIILSALFLHEGMGLAEIIGAVLVLGAAIVSETK